jgi:hypothetical protein
MNCGRGISMGLGIAGPYLPSGVAKVHSVVGGLAASHAIREHAWWSSTGRHAHGVIDVT